MTMQFPMNLSVQRLLGGVLALAFLTGVTLGLAFRPGSAAAGDEGALSAGPGDEVTANGKTEGAREELRLRSEIAGTVAALYVRTNEDVVRGTVLAELDNATHKAKVRQAEAELATARVDLQEATAADRRSRRLTTNRAAAVEELERNSFHKQRAAAQLELAQARLELARAELAKTQFRAPWDGRVLRIWVEPGALVGPDSAQSILLLADVSRRRVRVFVDDLDAGKVRPGQSVAVTADGWPGHEFSGHVSDEVLLRMDRDAPHSDAANEYQDIFHRPVVIDLDGGAELPLNLRVQARIHVNGDAVGRPASPSHGEPSAKRQSTFFPG